MTSPAERYAAFRSALDRDGPELTDFQALYEFDFDDFQLQACRALADGHSVLLAAPTGSGKTVVGEFAVHLAMSQGRKCFYTTPIKALSNQKYNDLVDRYSAAKVGLLTGDNSINGEAPIVVMTTEVLRNMLYAGSATLTGLSHVVLDEVHYLADRFRGAVWEEVIIHLPESVALTALSATVSNAEEFGDWLTSVRGDTTVIVDEHRPVPLWQHMLAWHRLYDLFATAESGRLEVNPDLIEVAQRDTWAHRGARGSARDQRGHRSRAPARAPRFAPPRRAEVITRLDRAGLLPAITFIFSRAGCEAAVLQCMAADLWLTTPAEAEQIAEVAAERTAEIPRADLAVLGYHDWLAGLRRGIAAHHAGMLPTFKEVVEELFTAGLIRAVFATETLALGINMPARTVVIEKLDKWNGEVHQFLTPGEYTQLTGRAGRRGIDVEGHAVVLWQPGIDPEAVAGLAGTRTYPLNSSFRPSYNMAVNLVGQVGKERASRLLESSFAQFQADRAVVPIARQAHRIRESMTGLAATCELGDFAEYMRIRSELSAQEKDRSRQRAAARRLATEESLRGLARGDIVAIPGGRRAGRAIVLEPDDSPAPVVLLLTEHHQIKRLTPADCPAPVKVLESIKVPAHFNFRSPRQRKDLAATMRNKLAAGGGRDRAAGQGEPAEAGPDEVAALRRKLREHPCHKCPDRETHARQSEKYFKLEGQAATLDRKVAQRAHVIARTFDRICAVLIELGYLDGENITPDGRVLAGLYCELDLLAAECLRRRIWHGLNAAELASCVSALTFEARRAEDGALPRLPPGRARDAAHAMNRLWDDLEATERDHQITPPREPDFGFAWQAHEWARGKSLQTVLGDEMTPGDFVRAVKQLIDLLDQIGVAAGGTPLAATARSAVGALRRGVVAYSSVQ